MNSTWQRGPGCGGLLKLIHYSKSDILLGAQAVPASERDEYIDNRVAFSDHMHKLFVVLEDPKTYQIIMSKRKRYLVEMLSNIWRSKLPSDCYQQIATYILALDQEPEIMNYIRSISNSINNYYI